MAHLHPAVCGSISNDTIRSQDLIEAFSNELSLLVRDERNVFTTADDIRLRNSWLDTVQEARDYLKILAQGEESPDEAIVIEILEKLTEGLEYFADEDDYFGAHEGDGASFGFWHTFDYWEDDNGDESPRAYGVSDRERFGSDY